MKAIRDCAIPHVTFTMLDGSNEPYDVCIPNTNVAESADVIKNEPINTSATSDKTIPKGK